MKSNIEKDALKIKKILVWYNAVPNVIWSVLNLAPISAYCYSVVEHKLLYYFIALGILPMFLPNSIFDKMRLGKTMHIYEKLGVDLINKVSQNGEIVNNLIRKKYPNYKSINSSRSSIHKLLQRTYVFEKFHFTMFVFFFLTTIYALSKNHFGWAALITLTNLLYNVYPNLLQQYIRIKLTLYSKRLNIKD